MKHYMMVIICLCVTSLGVVASDEVLIQENTKRDFYTPPHRKAPGLYKTLSDKSPQLVLSAANSDSRKRNTRNRRKNKADASLPKESIPVSLVQASKVSNGEVHDLIKQLSLLGEVLKQNGIVMANYEEFSFNNERIGNTKSNTRDTLLTTNDHLASAQLMLAENLLKMLNEQKSVTQ